MGSRAGETVSVLLRKAACWRLPESNLESTVSWASSMVNVKV